MAAYCLGCGRALEQVDKGKEVVPTCNSCQREYYDADLGWMTKAEAGAATIASFADIKTTVIKAETEDE